MPPARNMPLSWRGISTVLVRQSRQQIGEGAGNLSALHWDDLLEPEILAEEEACAEGGVGCLRPDAQDRRVCGRPRIFGGQLNDLDRPPLPDRHMAGYEDRRVVSCRGLGHSPGQGHRQVLQAAHTVDLFALQAGKVRRRTLAVLDRQERLTSATPHLTEPADLGDSSLNVINSDRTSCTLRAEEPSRLQVPADQPRIEQARESWLTTTRQLRHRSHRSQRA